MRQCTLVLTPFFKTVVVLHGVLTFRSFTATCRCGGCKEACHDRPAQEAWRIDICKYPSTWARFNSLPCPLNCKVVGMFSLSISSTLLNLPLDTRYSDSTSNCYGMEVVGESPYIPLQLSLSLGHLVPNICYHK
jgi:hypothetical protein